MKTFSIALAAAYAKPATTLCQCLKVTRSDGTIFAFTSADRDVVVDGVTYTSQTGLSLTNLVSTSGTAVDNLELRVLPDEDLYPMADIVAGKWDDAAFLLFECDYTLSPMPLSDVNELKRGTTGEADTARGSITLELRSLKQALQKAVGDLTSMNCRYRFGDAKCKVDLTPYTHAGSVVTAVASAWQFTCSGRTEASGAFKEGRAICTAGENVGYTRKIKDFAAGVFTLALPFNFPVQVGDVFTMVEGCLNTRDACIAHANILNFGGEPDVPGQDLLTADPTGSS